MSEKLEQNRCAALQRELDLIAAQGLSTNPLRMEYESKVRALTGLADRLQQLGLAEEEIARRLHAERRELGRVFKEAAPPLFRRYIYAATAAKYGDPLGPDFDTLRRSKSCAEIIASASRPIEDLSNRLTVEGFLRWAEAQNSLFEEGTAGEEDARQTEGKP
ncbi:MAG: hypothetical protein IJC43_07560 [Clostridia bacterium]|nr:hypothetical protein [Clostridia bacterium]